MHLALLLTLAQQSVAQAPAIARVEVTPATAEVRLGQTLQMAARAFDAAGRPVEGARFQWFNAGGAGEVDSTGLVSGTYVGNVRVTAAASVARGGNVFGNSVVKVVPQAATRIEIGSAPSRMVAGSRVTLVPATYSPQNDRTTDAVTFTSSAPRIVSVTNDGRVTAIAPGRATVTAKAGAAVRTLAVQVVPAASVARLTLEPASRTVRTGDVVRFAARAMDPAG